MARIVVEAVIISVVLLGWMHLFYLIDQKGIIRADNRNGHKQ